MLWRWEKRGKPSRIWKKELRKATEKKSVVDRYSPTCDGYKTMKGNVEKDVAVDN